MSLNKVKYTCNLSAQFLIIKKNLIKNRYTNSSFSVGIILIGILRTEDDRIEGRTCVLSVY